MTHQDFTPDPATVVLTQKARNALALRAANAAYRIRSSQQDPAKWKALIEAEPDDIRPLVREYLAQAYRAMQRRDRDKRSAAGDAELAKMAELARRL